MKTKKIISAGPLVKVALYPRGSRYDEPRVRSAKRRLSSEAQKRMNAKYLRDKLEMELAANFLPRDHWCTFTFRDEDLPKDEKGVEACVKAFRRRIVRACGRNAPVIFWRAEHKHEDDDFLTDRRWHVHACIQARSGSDYETLQLCWPYGRVDIEPIRIDKDHSYAQLAAYMVKEPLDRAGAHAWHNTRNAAKPEVETFPVPDDTTLQPPKGVLLCEDWHERNEFGIGQYLKYVEIRGLHPKGRPRAGRRR